MDPVDGAGIQRLLSTQSSLIQLCVATKCARGCRRITARNELQVNRMEIPVLPLELDFSSFRHKSRLQAIDASMQEHEGVGDLERLRRRETSRNYRGNPGQGYEL